MDLRGQTLQAFSGALDRLDILLQNDLLGGMGHLELGEVIHVSGRPAGLSRITESQSKKKAFEAVTGTMLLEDGAQAAADEIPESLIGLVGNAHGSELTGPEETGQLFGVPGVCLDSIARPLWDQGRSNYFAHKSASAQVAAEHETEGSGLVADADFLAGFIQLLEELVHRLDVPRDLSVATQRTVRGGQGDGDGIFMDVQPDMEDSLGDFHGCLFT